MKNSTSSRLAYSFFLLLGTIVSAIMLAPGLGQSLQNILPGICSNVSFIIKQKIDCNSVIGYFAVYRICFALTCFFFLFMVIMLFVRSSEDPRARIQNGFWFFKFLILLGIVVGAFFIPQNGAFEQVFMWFGIIGGCLFILIQLILLIDFAHSWNESWVEQYENDRKEFYYGLLIFTGIFFALTITLAVLGYVYYASVSKFNEKKIHSYSVLCTKFLGEC
jgi:small-conductance mechanosensitive channel